mgnify:CR=1 FL=1
MIIYTTTCLISVLLAWLVEHIRYGNKTPNTYIKAIIAAIPAIIVTGFRYGIGTDYFGYQGIFYSEGSFKDPLFSLFNQGIKILGGDFYTSIFVISIIFFTLVYIRIFEDSKYPWLSVFLLFGMIYFFAFMNAIRQFLAISILIYSIKFLEEKRNFLFFLFLLTAIGIHGASILFLAVFVITKIKCNFKYLLVATPLICILIYLGKNYIVTPLLGLLDYFNYTGTSVIGFRTVGGFLYQIVLTLLAYSGYRDFTSKNEEMKYRIYFGMQMLSLWMYSLWGGINENEINRILAYFQFSSIIFAPIVLQKLKAASIRKVIALSMILYFSANIYITIAVNNEQETLPYETVFSQM